VDAAPLASGSIADPSGGTCAEHAGRKASIVCRQCGDFACSECTVDTLWGETLCQKCMDRGRATYPLAWRSAIGLGAWLATSRAVLSEARVVFSHFPTGRPLRAFGYGMSWLLPLLALDFAMRGLGLTRASSTFAVDAVLILGAELVTHGGWLLSTALGYLVAVRMFGGKPSPSDAIAVAGYSIAFTAVTRLVIGLPILSLALIPATMLNLYFTAWSYSLSARTRFGLSTNRSWIAAVLALIGAFLLLLILAGVFAVARDAVFA
jgi:hypothetical protein